MPDLRRRTCRVCRKHSDEVGAISWTGKCILCAEEILLDNIAQMEAHSGPNFVAWRRGMAACVGAVLVDDVTAALQTLEP